MICGFGRIAVRALCTLAVLGLLAATPGCDDGAKKNGAAGGDIPANVKESNNNMQNFEKSQKAKK